MTPFMKVQVWRTIIATMLFAGGFARLSADEPVTIPKFTDWVIGVAFSPLDGSLASVGGQGLPYRPGDVMIWDAADGESELVARRACEHGLGRRLLAGRQDDGDRRLRRDDQALGHAGRQAAERVEEAQALGTAFAFTPDGKLLISGSEDTSVIVWEVDSGKDVKTIQAHAGPGQLGRHFAGRQDARDRGRRQAGEALGSRKGN